MYTIADNINHYKPAVLLNSLLTRKTMTMLRNTFFILAVIFASIFLANNTFNFSDNADVFLGLTLIFIALWIEQILLYSYHNSHYFYGLSSVLGTEDKKISGTTYEVAEALKNNPHDITKAFCNSQLGTLIMLRAGVDLNKLEDYLKSPRPLFSTDMVPLPETQIFSLISLGQYLLQQDASFKKFIQEQGVAEENFQGALNWVVTSYQQAKREDRWWGKDNLSKIQGLGREWSYGNTYLLEKFSRKLSAAAVFSNLGITDKPFSEEIINELEVALARAKASNILLIGEAGVGKIDLLLEVEKRMKSGQSISSVKNQRFVLLDTDRLFIAYSDKQTLELNIYSIFNEAAKAGNVILVIENLSVFIKKAEAVGIFIPELIDPFLAAAQMHVIGTDTPNAYHTHLETLGAFARRFDEVLIETRGLKSTTKMLQTIALNLENKYQVLFTYPSLQAITTTADRYLVEGVMPDKAIELLTDIATRASQSQKTIITEDYVYSVVSQKTGIPSGPIGEKERDLLLNLEETLHQRVIGQQPALTTIAKTMRRARAGIQANDKPIGSFLFLGPTGVGKTETAKALAYVFFGGENHMHRIDMSEFSGPDALTRLIGNGTESGILSDMLHENPYSVLLLDEFEKAATAVHDLFLQILDEGIFTDARGDKINARNTIIIPTSNPGSDLIIRTVNQRKELATLSAEIINYIINEGVYRPELINRFDSTVIFEPLTREEQGQIAGLLLKGLYERVKEKGYELNVNRDLIEIVVEKGYSLEFGARPMQRVIQDIIEEKIATLIISGTVSKGDNIHLTKADFSDLI